MAIISIKDKRKLYCARKRKYWAFCMNFWTCVWCLLSLDIHLFMHWNTTYSWQFVSQTFEYLNRNARHLFSLEVFKIILHLITSLHEIPLQHKPAKRTSEIVYLSCTIYSYKKKIMASAWLCSIIFRGNAECVYKENSIRGRVGCLIILGLCNSIVY